MAMHDIRLGARAQTSAVWLSARNPLRRAGSWCPVKTAEGQAEIRQRRRRLTQRQRTLLLLVDGRRSAEQVQSLALQAGATDTAFDELLDLGLIAAPPPETPRPEAPAEDETLAALDAADTGEAIDWGLASDADPFEQFERDAEQSPEESAPTTPRRVDAVVSSLLPFIESAFGVHGPGDAPLTSDDTLEEARRTLVREVRGKAPLTGAFTLAKLRRARNREELAALLDEVESRISTPMRHLSARQTLQYVRGLLTGDDAADAMDDTA
jgi:hypothetical protein